MSPTELSKASGISVPYASQILNGRNPPRSLAIHILRTAGWRHSVLDGLSDAEIEVFEKHEPWIAPADRAA